MTSPSRIAPSRIAPSRIAVIGDVGGHLEELRAELTRLGVPDDGEGPLPPDLVVVQVGDLLHRGPDSDGVIELVDGHLDRSPSQWLQLVGNHEALYLGEPAFRWPERVSAATATTINRWWASGRMLAAASFRSAGEPFLVTHAGLTHGFWRDVLGSPADAGAAAAAINALITHEDRRLFRGGQLLGGGDADLGAGPMWAVAGSELLPSWRDVPMPFSQIHGHTSLVDWRDGSWADNRFASIAAVDPQAKHVDVRLDGGRIIGIDPGHVREPRVPWASWEAPLQAGRA